jgi:mercuric ion binding protein
MKLSAQDIVAAIFISAASLTVSSAPATAQAVTASERTVVFAVENMTCALCPITVRKAMERVPGVASVTVDADAMTATVVYDPARASDDAIAAASAGAGYPAKVTEI